MNTDIQIQILRSRNFLVESKDHPPPPKKQTTATKNQPNKQTKEPKFRSFKTELEELTNSVCVHASAFQIVFFFFGCISQHNRADMLATSQHNWRMIWAETGLGSLLVACTQAIKSLNRINKNTIRT